MNIRTEAELIGLIGMERLGGKGGLRRRTPTRSDGEEYPRRVLIRPERSPHRATDQARTRVAVGPLCRSCLAASPPLRGREKCIVKLLSPAQRGRRVERSANQRGPTAHPIDQPFSASLPARAPSAARSSRLLPPLRGREKSCSPFPRKRGSEELHFSSPVAPESEVTME